MPTPANDFFNKLEGTWANKLNGEWQDTLGWNFISQPKFGQAGLDDFMMRHDQMRESISFKRLGVARNVGVTGEAGFWAGMAYTIGIRNLAGEDIHQEMGHILMQVEDQNGDTIQPLEAPILRQASIPRANAVLTPGKLFIGSVVGAPDIYDAYPSAGLNAPLQQRIDTGFQEHQNASKAAGGPDFRQPITWLATQFPGPVLGTADWVFDFHEDTNNDSMASGERVGNPVGVGDLLSAFWIGDRIFDEGEVEILQYAQVVDVKFNGIRWPHTAVNSLFKQPAAPAAEA